MECQKCQQRPANVHITQFINGAKQEVHLCDQCAQDVKTNLQIPQLPLHNLNNLLGFFTQNYNLDKMVHDKFCPVCHTSYRKIAETGYVGCSSCYQSFSSHLDPILRKIHGSNKHRGKIPQRMGASFLLRKEIEDLKLELRQVLEREAYEEAARLRDKIKALEKKLTKGQV